MVISRTIFLLLIAATIGSAQKTLFIAEQAGIKLNENVTALDEYLKDVDYLTLLIVFDSEKPKSQNVFQHVLLPVI